MSAGGSPNGPSPGCVLVQDRRRRVTADGHSRWERLPCAHATTEGAKFGLCTPRLARFGTVLPHNRDFDLETCRTGQLSIFRGEFWPPQRPRARRDDVPATYSALAMNTRLRVSDGRSGHGVGCVESPAPPGAASVVVTRDPPLGHRPLRRGAGSSGVGTAGPADPHPPPRSRRGRRYQCRPWQSGLAGGTGRRYRTPNESSPSPP